VEIPVLIEPIAGNGYLARGAEPHRLAGFVGMLKDDPQIAEWKNR
jgi:hypothetical protein